MNKINRTLFVLLIFSSAIPAYSQDKNNTQKVEKKEEIRPDGLRKISTKHQDWDFDINIDEKALKANIEKAIESAMKSVDVALEKLEINIEPIVINMKGLNMDVNPIRIDIPNINIDIEPIEVDLGDLNINTDVRHHAFDRAADKDEGNNYGVAEDDYNDKVIHA